MVTQRSFVLAIGRIFFPLLDDVADVLWSLRFPLLIPLLLALTLLAAVCGMDWALEAFGESLA